MMSYVAQWDSYNARYVSDHRIKNNVAMHQCIGGLRGIANALQAERAQWALSLAEDFNFLADFAQRISKKGDFIRQENTNEQLRKIFADIFSNRESIVNGYRGCVDQVSVEEIKTALKQKHPSLALLAMLCATRHSIESDNPILSSLKNIDTEVFAKRELCSSTCVGVSGAIGISLAAATITWLLPSCF